MKKFTKRIQMILLGAAVALAMVLSAAAAVKTSADYTYTVRIFAGNQGTIGGQSVVEYTGKAPGSTIYFSNDMVTLNNSSKYYVLGLKESGKDNYDPEYPLKVNEAITVDGDKDYVVAYGVLGNSVAYTITYVTEDGTQLGRDTFYGNIGDKAVIAFKYFEGYAPKGDSREQTFTLTANASENNITFVYGVSAVEGDEAAGGGESESTATEETNTTDETTTAADGNNANGTGNNTSSNGSGNGSNGSGENGNGSEDVNGNGGSQGGETGTSSMVIEESTVPLAQGGGSGLSTGAIIAITAGGALLLALIIILIILSSRRRN